MAELDENLDGVLNRFELKRDDFDFECPRKTRDRIAEEIIEEWYLVGRALDVSDKKLKSIRCDSSLTLPEEKAVALLEAWAEEHGSKATCLRLAEALYGRKKTSVVEILCRKVKLMIKNESTSGSSVTSAAVSHQPPYNHQQQGGKATQIKFPVIYLSLI